MKKLFCRVMALCMLASCACAQSNDTFTLWFEDGFSLSIPEGWVYYAVSTDDAGAGVRYVLGDGNGSRYMYIQRQSTDISDVSALVEAIDDREDWEKTSELRFNDQEFIAFIVPDCNISGCATILDGDFLTFVFSPQNDSVYMLTATEIMQSFSSQS